MTKVYWKQLYEKKKKLAIESLGGKCVNCGAIENLEFHHIDPQTKEFTVTQYIRQDISEELKKCQLLCKNCHKEKTATHHGRRRKYQNGCRCQFCIEANRIYMRNYYLTH
jgi:5-methylcytosine-specific restriction endonuclease McrA